MDRNKKRALGVFGVLFVWRIYESVKLRNRIDDMEEKLDIVDKIQDKLLQTLDDAAQPAFDEEFENIIERFND